MWHIEHTKSVLDMPQTNGIFWCILSMYKKERVTPHAEKLTSLFLSLLLSLSLLPGQARAAGAPEPAAPPVAVEPSGPETQEEPPVMPLSAPDFPDEEDMHHGYGMSNPRCSFISRCV